MQSTRRVTKNCPQCRRDFTVYASEVSKFKRCSLACMLAASSNVLKACERCGAGFRGAPRRRHCSEQCRRPALTITCEHCTKVVRVSPAKAERRFCSVICYLSHRGPTQPETNVATALTSEGVAFVREWPLPSTNYSCDFLLTEHATVIELDGLYWHERTRERDADKTRRIVERGLRLLRVTITARISHATASAIVAAAVHNDAVALDQCSGIGPVELTLPQAQDRMILSHEQAAFVGL